MSTIVTRAGKGSPLTHDEVDANFNNLNTDKAEKTVTNTFTANQIVSVTDNTNAALRITQLGTGNALLVEDSTNPDASPFVIDSSGKVIAGYTTPITTSGSFSPLIQSVAAGQTAGFGTSAWLNSTAGGNVIFAKSRSGTIGTFGIVSSGDDLGSVRFDGDDGTQFVRAAQITSQVDGTPGTNDMPGRLVFSTTADGASTPTERMRINSLGQVGIGTSNTAGTTVRIGTNITGAVTSYGLFNASQVQSDVTTSARAYSTSIGTVNSVFTLAGLDHYRATQGTFGASSTVTSQYGFTADSTLTGATNNYGFYGNIASGANRWNLYMNGTAANYFNGDLTVYGGTAIPAGGTAGSGYKLSSTANFGVFFGSGVPTLSAAKGSLYLRSDGTTINDRMYVNTNGSTTWTAVITAA
jgi:hypothetical protein